MVSIFKVLAIFFRIWVGLFCVSLLAQEGGMPFYRVYEPGEYQGHRQNWAIAQDEQGVMYFGNGKGLLVYNGEEWHLEMLPNEDHIRSLTASNGKIYVGGHNELGYFQESGLSYVYNSYLDHIPENLKNFDRVWTTLVFEESVYYQTDTFVLRVSSDNSSKIWQFSDLNAWKLIDFEDELYLDIPLKGLHRLTDEDTFELIPGGELLHLVGFEFMIQTDKGIVFEKLDTLRIFDGSKVLAFENDAASTFLEYGVDKGLKTKSGDLVFSTRKKGGVVILDQEGKLKSHFASINGFSNEVIRNIYEDFEGSIWFALNSGISRLDWHSPLTFHSAKNNLNGTVLTINSYQDRLFAGGSDGLQVLNGSEFSQVGEIRALVMDLEVVNNYMIIATSNDKLYSLDELGLIAEIDDNMTKNQGINLGIQPLTEDPNSCVVLYQEGLYQLRWRNGQWKVEQELINGFIDAEEIYQQKSGVLWVSTGVNGLFRIAYSTSNNGVINFEQAEVKNYRKDQGVPIGVNHFFSIDDQLNIISPTGTTLSLDNNQVAFIPIPDFWKLLDQDFSGVGLLDNSNQDILWLQAEQDSVNYLIRSEHTNKSYTTKVYPLNLFAASFQDPFGSLAFYAADDRVYFGGINGIVEYRLTEQSKISEKVNVIVYSVRTTDSVYYEIPATFSLDPLPYNNNVLGFHFTNTNYKDAENKRYQYILEGYDEDWSAPNEDNFKEYSRLPPGDYKFKVRALNDYNIQSSEAVVNFIVNKPWFWNNYSMVFYLFLIGLLTYLISQWRSRTLRQRNLALQKAVNEAVDETKRQAEEIAELYEVKNQFFSNISHELRTPLTLIIGPSSDLMEDEELSAKQRSTLTFINNNSKRLLRLINQLLDLSKLEAGKLEIRVSQQDIVTFLSTLSSSFESLAVARKIKLIFNPEVDQLYVFYDPEKLEQVIINLLSNALKFTPEGGSVTVSVSKSDNSCRIVVEDTGIGIHEEQLPYIFDRFYQADKREIKEYEGTGIGLSLTKELVELHCGTITVKSQYGAGSSFILTLLLGREHFEKDQLTKFSRTPKETLTTIPAQFAEESPDLTGTAENEVVLIVEDNMEMRSYIRDLLSANYSILEAADGLEGFEIAKTQVPDLIISDVMMPKMDGTELCKNIKQNDITAHIPLILLTAKASEEDKIKGLQIEADEYLAKPFNKIELLARIENLIRNRRKLQKRFAKSALISPREIAVSSMEQVFLEKLVAEIDQNYGDEAYGVEPLAKAMNLSRSQLHRKMLSILDQPPSLFLRKYRLERAKQLLEKGAGRVSDIAYEVGFSSPSYFTKCFVEKFGYPPKEVLKSGQ